MRVFELQQTHQFCRQSVFLLVNIFPTYLKSFLRVFGVTLKKCGILTFPVVKLSPEITRFIIEKSVINLWNPRAVTSLTLSKTSDESGVLELCVKFNRFSHEKVLYKT